MILFIMLVILKNKLKLWTFWEQGNFNQEHFFGFN